MTTSATATPEVMTKEDILKGIQAYGEQKQEILAAIDKYGGELTDNQFDHEFGDYYDEMLPNGEHVRVRNEPRLVLWSHNDKAFILGNFAIHDDWSKYLHLAQLMVQAGILEREENDDVVIYRRA